MTIIRIIAQIIILNIFYYAGVAVVEITGLHLPGSIIGLLLLYLTLHFKWIKVEYIKDGAGFLISVLTLFFIPSTVGVIEYPQLWTKEGMLVLLAVAMSTMIVIFTTGKLCQFIEQKENASKKNEQEEGNANAFVESTIHHR